MGVSSLQVMWLDGVHPRGRPTRQTVLVNLDPNLDPNQICYTKIMRVFGEPDQAAIAQLENCLNDERAVAGALMADHHLGYSMPIGGVVAYQDAISPTGVGFDIGCGNMAVKTDLKYYDLTNLETGDHYRLVKGLMRTIQKKVAFGLGRTNPEPVEHELFEDDFWPWLDRAAGRGLKDKAQAQLGTVGSGNHYVDLLVDEEGFVWVANHFGSRGLGHTICKGFMALASGQAFTDRVAESEDAVVFPTQEGVGEFYIKAMELAGQYAYAGREFVMQQVLDILEATAIKTVHNHHNYAWLEDGLWVVRKGATPLTTEPAFIGGSMGDVSVIVRGRSADSLDEFVEYDGDSVMDIGALGSAPHGAGRVMSRNKAAGKMKTKRNEAGKKVRYRDKSTALIDWDVERAKLNERGIVVLGAGADESPGVYKDLGTVLAAHDNIEILHRLQPLGVVMAGEDTFDPFKD